MNLMLEKYPDSSPVFLPSTLASGKLRGPRERDPPPPPVLAGRRHLPFSRLCVGAWRGSAGDPTLKGTGTEGLEASRRSSATVVCDKHVRRVPGPSSSVFRPVNSIALVLALLLVKLPKDVARSSHLPTPAPAVPLSLPTSGPSSALSLLSEGSGSFPNFLGQ